MILRRLGWTLLPALSAALPLAAFPLGLSARSTAAVLPLACCPLLAAAAVFAVGVAHGEPAALAAQRLLLHSLVGVPLLAMLYACAAIPVLFLLGDAGLSFGARALAYGGGWWLSAAAVAARMAWQLAGAPPQPV